MTRVEQNQWSAEQTLSYINGLIAAEENEDENTIMAALSIAYEYLINATKRKITWSLSLEKLAVLCLPFSMNSSTWPSRLTCMPRSRISSNPIDPSHKDNTPNHLSAFSNTIGIQNWRTS